MTSNLDPIGNDLNSSGVFVVQRALLGSGWACAPKNLTCVEVQAALDAKGEVYLPGTPWTVAPREHTHPMLASPSRCDECPDERQHWMLLGGMTAAVIMAISDDASGFPEDLQLR